MDVLEKFKAAQKAAWVHFTPLQAATTPTAARLVHHARIAAGARVLDVACGTGVVAITAARAGAIVTGLDLTPELLAVARDNARISGTTIDWHEGDVEELPFDTAAFDVVTSQFGHMFAPRADIALAEMLRVLKPGGTIAFSTWPPEAFVGRVFAVMAQYMPPLPPGVSPPPLWGDVHVVRERLGPAVRDLRFDRAALSAPALSPQHYRGMLEQTAGPLRKLVESMAAEDAEKLAAARGALDALIEEYFEHNVVRQDYLLTRAIKI